MADQTIQIDIFGQTYSLKGGPDGDYVRELAAFVNARMREVQKGMGTSDGYRVAILTALNIADELHRLRTQHEDLRGSTRDFLDRIIEISGTASSQK